MARTPASGTQHALRAGDYEAVIASVGASLRSLTYGGRDLVVPFDDDTPRDLIVAAMPDVLVKGGDYTAETTAGAAEVLAHGGRFVAIPFAFDRSTSALVARIRRG